MPFRPSAVNVWISLGGLTNDPARIAGVHADISERQRVRFAVAAQRGRILGRVSISRRLSAGLIARCNQCWAMLVIDAVTQY